MEYTGTIFPSLILGESSPEKYYISSIVQLVLFIVFIIVVLGIIRLYLKNIELSKNAEKNQKEIQENMEKMKKRISLLMKVGGIIFGVVIFSQIILGNFFE